MLACEYISLFHVSHCHYFTTTRVSFLYMYPCSMRAVLEGGKGVVCYHPSSQKKMDHVQARTASGAVSEQVSTTCMKVCVQTSPILWTFFSPLPPSVTKVVCPSLSSLLLLSLPLLPPPPHSLFPLSPLPSLFNPIHHHCSCHQYISIQIHSSPST